MMFIYCFSFAVLIPDLCTITYFYMYTVSHNGNIKIMRENMHDVHLLPFFSKIYFPLNVCFISMH